MRSTRSMHNFLFPFNTVKECVIVLYDVFLIRYWEVNTNAVLSPKMHKWVCLIMRCYRRCGILYRSTLMPGAIVKFQHRDLCLFVEVNIFYLIVTYICNLKIIWQQFPVVWINCLTSFNQNNYLSSVYRSWLLATLFS